MLAVDAFSGNAITLDLPTVEAMRTCRRHREPGGVIAFHVSNQILNLTQVIGVPAEAVGM